MSNNTLPKTTFTRQELYELIWTRPIHQLSSEFSLSDVGLAKTCARFNIPRPPRGYWQQVAVGIQGTRPRLPALPKNLPEVITFDRVSPPAAPGQPKLEPPVVQVPDRLSDPHDAVKWLQAAFSTAKPDRYDRLVVGSSYSPCCCVKVQHKDRALRLLDALIKALTARGHEVTAGGRFENSSGTEIVVKVGESTFGLQVEERLGRKPHMLTRDEKERKEKWGLRHPLYDYFPNGALCLKVEYMHYAYRGRKSWSDETKRRLDDLLGRAVLAIEEASRIARIEHEEQERQNELRLIEERKRLRAERMRWYGQWLADDLDDMIATWQRAQRVRDFLAEHERRLPQGEQAARTTDWRRAVAAFAERLDPMNRAADIAKEMEPDDATLERLIAAANARSNDSKSPR